MTATADLLETIVAATRRIVEVREAARPVRALEQEQRGTPDGEAFRRALREASGVAGDVRIIAECKRRSPSRGILREHYVPADHARDYAAAGAAAISVLTEPTFFDGSLDHLREVRAAVDIPVLRKDFIVSEYQLVEAAACGADAVLLIVAAVSPRELATLIRSADAQHLATLVEVHDVNELHVAVDASASVIGVNSRDLRTLSVDLSVLDELAAKLPKGVTAVAESGIRTRDDIIRLSAAGYHAFLVGEGLIAETDPGRALWELRGAC